MNLFKVVLNYGYDYQKAFVFMIVAPDVQSAVDKAKDVFYSYDYGSASFHSIELLASEGQYSKPDILLIVDNDKKK